MERLVSYLRLPSDVKYDRWPLVGAAVVGVAIVWTALLRSKSKKRGHPLPPGPKGLPVVGNLLQIPIEHPWLVYNEWKKEYGDMIYLNAMGQGILILNSLTTIDDLLTKRATNYSDRVQSALIPLTKIGWAFSVMNYGPWWRDHRRDFHRFFNNTQIPNYYPVIEEETLTFLRKLVADPKDFREQALLLFGSIIMRLSYGVEDLEYNKVLMEASETILQDFMEYSAPGRLLVTTFPSLRHVPSWFPGAGWRRITDRLAKLNDELVGRPFDEMKERIYTCRTRRFTRGKTRKNPYP
ncbi:cytochrome P450 [Coprinopsis cinerea AmutBmut pab1-1]|nr:cytochrome P450 [Coprinopsis cinerea AmutBmut pab1-1]